MAGKQYVGVREGFSAGDLQERLNKVVNGSGAQAVLGGREGTIVLEGDLNDHQREILRAAHNLETSYWGPDGFKVGLSENTGHHDHIGFRAYPSIDD
ncbi:MAG: hypothetical protein KDI13_00030 [Alphaproteobacteria bacterium]|nr:hypothetical protein [Alphaproteobacteria bacterium]